MSETPTISVKTLKSLGRRIDSEFVSAKKLEGRYGLYWKLNKRYPAEDGWVMLRAPVWIGEHLVAFICKPRTE